LSPNALLAPLAALAVGAVTGTASAQRVLDYAQLDGSSESWTVVGVRALGDPRAATPAPLVSATYTRWADGEAGGLGVVYRFGLPTAEHAASLGVGAGVNGYRSRVPGEIDSETSLSLRLQAESYGPAPGGHYYVLGQASTFRRGWLATAQYAPAAWPVAFELTRYAETGYHATTAVLRLAVGGSGWWLRVGAVDDTGGRRALAGVAYNGF
jgi:hypothetical protein